MLFLYLLLALFSGLAPQGVQGPDDVQAGSSVGLSPTDHVAHFAVIAPATPARQQAPDSPAESEREEEEVREYESGPTGRTVAVRVTLSFLASYLIPSSCLPDPPNVVRAPKLLPAPGTTRTILHQVFRI